MKIDASITETKEFTITISQSELNQILIERLRADGLLPDGEAGQLKITFDGNFEIYDGVVYLDFRAEKTSPAQLHRGKVKPRKP